MILEIDPLADRRWPEFLSVQPGSSVFHTPCWLEALHRTYGHKPAALIASGPHGEITDALVFCRLHSPLSGRRLISIPFSDHCEFLITRDVQAAELLSQFGETARAEECAYGEIRPV